MRQTKNMSLLEAVTDVGIGIVGAMYLTHYVMPIWGYQANIGSDFLIVGMFSVWSFFRKFIIRRVFDYYV
tara:strand:+ start:599 stop:808 length:210 start_codon:yes stop_codon:yes gene_type:complete